MASDKNTARVQNMVMVVSLLGVAVLVGGIVLFVRMLTADLNQPGMLWNFAVYHATPAVVIGLVGLVMAVMPWVILTAVQVLTVRQQEERWRHEQLISAMEATRKAVEGLKETASLSDAAKMITFRAKDREALRAAIKEEMDHGDFEAAVALVDDMERRFGYRQEAETLRDTIDQNWRATRDQQVRDTIEQIEELMARFDWRASDTECARLLKLNPDHPEARALPGRIEAARDAHKRDLLKQWKEAVARDDLDRSVVLLTELDQYLTRSEAKAYEEAARDVFRKRLQQLGVQFALHVHDKSWMEAVRVGRQIVDEFPNTRIAAEVRDKLPILEEKIGSGAAV